MRWNEGVFILPACLTDKDLSAVKTCEAGQDTKHRRLAGARRAEDRCYTHRRHGKFDVQLKVAQSPFRLQADAVLILLEGHEACRTRRRSMKDVSTTTDSEKSTMPSANVLAAA